MARKIDLDKSSESHCPRFEQCSINKCPLHKDFPILKNDGSDPSKQHKEKCTSKRIRKEIGKAFGLKYGGMTTREFDGAKRWASLSDEERQSKVSKLQDLSPVARLIKSGCVVSPKKKIKSQIHRVECKNLVEQGKNGVPVGVRG